jgi:hypothetical protein
MQESISLFIISYVLNWLMAWCDNECNEHADTQRRRTVQKSWGGGPGGGALVMWWA